MLRIRESGADLARATGGVVTRSHVTSLRKGPIENPGMDKLRALASRRWVPLCSLVRGGSEVSVQKTSLKCRTASCPYWV